MNSKRDMNLIARVASKRTKPKGNTKATRPQGTPSLPSSAQLENDELLRFFNDSCDLLCIGGFDGFFKRLNPAWTTTVGWTIAELQARPFLDFVLPADRPATLAEMDKLAAGEPTIYFENRYACKDGSYKWLQWTSRPLPGRREIYAIARDVTRQRLLEKEILDTLDRERERVGRELHDGICQDLAAIAAFASSLARKLARASSSMAEEAREIADLLGRSILHTRDLARGFIPLHLKGVGLTSALESFCSNTESLFKIACRFRCEPRPLKLELDRSSHLYRIAQEAVNNAIAHGRATQIEVSLAFKGSRGMLAIHDDGVGLGDAPEGEQSGIGVLTMKRRARLIGGALEITRRSPRGTSITCGFPLPREVSSVSFS